MNSGFWTVVGFTARNKLRAKSFMITTLIIAVIMSIGINLPYIISQFSGESKPTPVGYLVTTVDQTSSQMFTASQIGTLLTEYYKSQQPKPDLNIVTIKPANDSDKDNEEALKKAVADGTIDGYITFTPSKNKGDFPIVTYKSESLMEGKVSQSLKGALQGVKQEAILRGGGLSDELMTLLRSPVQLDTVQISTNGGAGSIGQGKTEEEQGMDMLTVYVIIILLFMAIMISGQMIASEITAEKSSRVMEILITSVAPLRAMFGKIFGMFLVVLVQLAIYIVVIVINMTLPHNKEKLGDMGISLSNIDPVLVIYALLFFLTGYYLFATLFAAVGSIVSRTEDLGQAVLPITMISLAGFYICILGGIQNPGSTLVKVSSFIPFFSPYAMVVRLGLSDPPLWQVWLSIAILLASILAAGWLSAKIYRAGVLMYGKKPTLREIGKAMRSYK
ncbi:ABC-2 type transport system permease protein [Paenibacillus taihuensis]|uniref:ABC-2 type transport system permease protein n=1 Tax=Paenibacillus taihuensis TaxID=1156355 RepID=A0A3D9R1G5_9BACL|nr:ABC transporter permease [Paenibacillus taihuensis]REE67983.1 ABC-2 type transport system permease protein [Paenibacillus taihuensis]